MSRPRDVLRAAKRRVTARAKTLLRAWQPDRAALPVQGEHTLDGFGWRNRLIPATRSEKQHAAARGSHRPLAKLQLRREVDQDLTDALERVRDADDVGLSAAARRRVAQEIAGQDVSSRELFRLIDAAKRQED